MMKARRAPFFRRVWKVSKCLIQRTTKDDILTLAAAIAFFTALSLPPLVLLLLAAGSLAGPEFEADLIKQVGRSFGAEAGTTVKELASRLPRDQPATDLAGLLGLCTLLFAATSVFSHLQNALNRIWGVTSAPGRGLFNWAKKRLLSLGFIAVIGVLLIVSLVVDGAISWASQQASDFLPGSDWVWLIINKGITLFVFATLFGLTFRVLPDAKITWSQVRLGGWVTAVLFSGGQIVIGLYIGQAAVGSAYGGAGSVIVFLVWTYYAAAIILFGAEVTRVRAHYHGQRYAIPEAHAVLTRHQHSA